MKIDATALKWFEGWDWVKVEFIKSRGRYRITAKPHGLKPISGGYSRGAGEWSDTVWELTRLAGGMYEAGVSYHGDKPLLPPEPGPKLLAALEAERDQIDREIRELREALGLPGPTVNPDKSG